MFIKNNNEPRTLELKFDCKNFLELEQIANHHDVRFQDHLPAFLEAWLYFHHAFKKEQVVIVTVINLNSLTYNSQIVLLNHILKVMRSHDLHFVFVE